MPIRENREYRNLPVFEIETRSEQEEPSYLVKGYASTFEDYKLFDYDNTEVYERILPNAFDDADMSDVIFQCDHNGQVMARTSNGTIQLSVDGHGLYQITDLSKTARAREMYDEIKAGMYTKMSFAFNVVEDEVVRESDERITRVIKRIGKVYDVSAVSFPANDTTNISVQARSSIDGFIKDEQVELLKRAKDLELAKAKYFYEEVK